MSAQRLQNPAREVLILVSVVHLSDIAQRTPQHSLPSVLQRAHGSHLVHCQHRHEQRLFEVLQAVRRRPHDQGRLHSPDVQREGNVGDRARLRGRSLGRARTEGHGVV